MILLIIGLSGCNKNINKINFAENFFGTWENTENSDSYEKWTFYENGSLEDFQSEIIEDEIYESVSWLKYQVNKSYLCFSPIDEVSDSPSYYYECFSYEFSSDNTSFYLFYNEIKIMEFTKV